MTKYLQPPYDVKAFQIYAYERIYLRPLFVNAQYTPQPQPKPNVKSYNKYYRRWKSAQKVIEDQLLDKNLGSSNV